MNHLYLEDCFIQWKRLPEAVDDRYTLFPHGVNYMSLLGNAKLTDRDLDRWTAPAKDIDDDDDMQEIDGDITATGVTPPTQASSPSQNDRTARQEDLEANPGETHTARIEMDAIATPMEAVVEDLPPRPPSLTRADPPQASPSRAIVSDVPAVIQEDVIDEQPPIQESHNHRSPTPQLDEMIPQEPLDREPTTVQPIESVSSPLSGDPEDDHDMGQAAADDQVDDVVHEIPQQSNDGKGQQQLEEDVTMHLAEPAEPLVDAKPVGRTKVPATRSQTEIGAVATTPSKTRASTQAVKKSRSEVPSTTQPVKRRRTSISGKETSPAVVQPAPEFQGRARRQAATKAAEMLHNVIAPDMALHDKEKKRKNIVSPKSRREARVGGKGEGSSRKSKLDHEITDGEESTEDELETHLKTKGTQRTATAKKTPAAARGRSRSTVLRDTARTRLGSRSGSVLSTLSGEEEEDTSGDLKPNDVKLMTTGFNVEERLAKVSILMPHVAARSVTY